MIHTRPISNSIYRIQFDAYVAYEKIWLPRLLLAILGLLIYQPLKAETVYVVLRTDDFSVSASTARFAFAKASQFWRQCGFILEEGEGIISVQWGTVEAPRLAYTDVTRLGKFLVSAKITISSELSGSEMEKVMTHEFGHVLGLPHSADPMSIMHSSARGRYLPLIERQLCLDLSKRLLHRAPAAGL